MARWFSPVRDFVASLAAGATGTTLPVPPTLLTSAPEDVVLGTVEQPALASDRLFVVRYVGSATPEGLPSNARGSNERDVLRLELRVSYLYTLDADAHATRLGLDRQERARCRAADDMRVIVSALEHPDNLGDAGNGVEVLSIALDGEHRIEDSRNGVSIVSVFPLRVDVASSRIATWSVGDNGGDA